MNETSESKKYSDLKKNFANVKNEYRPFSFFTLNGNISDPAFYTSRLNFVKKQGFGGVVLLPTKNTKPEYLTKDYFSAISEIAALCATLNLEVAISDDCDTSASCPSGYAGGKFRELFPDLCARTLNRYEYKCEEREKVELKINPARGVLMSVVAYDDDRNETLFLMHKVEPDGVLRCEMPEGNWIIYSFYCAKSENARHVNYLDYHASFKYAELTRGALAEAVSLFDHDGKLTCVFESAQYMTENRRDWDENFNKFFKDLYGFDPAPYYLTMFIDTDENAFYYRGLLLHCRSEMFQSGFFKAVSDYTHSHLMYSAGSVAVPKALSAPWVFGDGMKYQKRNDFAYAKVTHKYMYGINCMKLASSAAGNYDISNTVCDMFRSYYLESDSVLYKEAMNVFSRGAGRLWIRDDMTSSGNGYEKYLPDFCNYATRCSSLLNGGRHVAEVAMLYTISSFESQTYLFEDHNVTDGYEYPVAPVNADFMNVTNSLMNYSGCDATVIHPETLNKHCFVEKGRLRMNSRFNSESFELLIVPGCQLISLENMKKVAELFDGGGKIIATSCLPYTALEQYKDPLASKELEKLIQHIFGVDREQKLLADFHVNKNSNGGVAYFIHSSATAVDGTNMISPEMLNDVMNELDLHRDVIIHDMPKTEDNGLLNLYYPMYKGIMSRDVPFVGMFNYIHKQYHGTEVYFFSNTTKTDYNGKIEVSGRFDLEEWNPHSGKIQRLKTDHRTVNGREYSAAEVLIPSAGSTFIVGTAEKEASKIFKNIFRSK